MTRNCKLDPAQVAMGGGLYIYCAACHGVEPGLVRSARAGPAPIHVALNPDAFYTGRA